MLGLKPIKTLPIREKIAANLREAILQKIPAGEILTLESTAQELGVSITPTREAFRFWQEMDFWNWSEINVQ